jgi:hypothetical protein
MTWFNNLSNTIEFDFYFLEMINEVVPLNDDNNIDLLQALIDKIPMDDFEIIMTHLQADKKFSHQQLAIIEEKRLTLFPEDSVSINVGI